MKELSRDNGYLGLLEVGIALRDHSTLISHTVGRIWCQTCLMIVYVLECGYVCVFADVRG